MISKECLEEYKAIYRKKFNKEISDEKALRQAISLFTLVKAVYKPITANDLKRVEERRKQTK